MQSLNSSTDLILDNVKGMLNLLATLDDISDLAGSQYAELAPLLEGMRYSLDGVKELNKAASEILGSVKTSNIFMAEDLHVINIFLGISACIKETRYCCRVIDFMKTEGKINIGEWLVEPDKWAQLVRGANAFNDLMKVFTLVNVQFDGMFSSKIPFLPENNPDISKHVISREAFSIKLTLIVLLSFLEVKFTQLSDTSYDFLKSYNLDDATISTILNTNVNSTKVKLIMIFIRLCLDIISLR